MGENDNSIIKNAYGMFVEDMNKYSVLSREDEKTLFTRLKNGDESAREIIANSNMRLVNKIARCYLNCGVSEMGLIEAGSIGLAIAINKFNVDLGNRFSTYATNWIKQAIVREISNTGSLIRTPVNKGEKLKKINKVVAQLSIDGETPSEDEILVASGISKKEYDSIPKYTYVSLDTPIGEDGDNSLGDFIEDSSIDARDIAEKKELAAILEAALNTLTSKEKLVLKMRNGIGRAKSCTLDEIGKVLGLSRERIRQIEVQSLRKLRNSKYFTMLADFA